MAFCFKRKESVAKAVRRLGEERIDKALDCLKDRDRAEAIHCARKEIRTHLINRERVRCQRFAATARREEGEYP